MKVDAASQARIPLPPGYGDSRRAFALWARSYDDSLNPMLSLEERILPEILPDMRGRDVVDVGCGTGRWLERIAGESPANMVGIDSSAEMLERARRKLGARATLEQGDAMSLPVASGSADVILASFVASYVPDLTVFAAELRRIARKGAQVFLSDLHPETAAACHWKRAFRTDGTHVEMLTYAHSVQETISTFEAAGFEVGCLLEPPFGPTELEIFRTAGRLESFYSAAGLPAIFVLQVRVAEDPAGSVEVTVPAERRLRLLGARVALGPEESISAEIRIDDGRVASIGRMSHERRVPEANSFDLDGYLVLPGLINAHDHLEFGLYPNLGRGSYRNFEEWASDIQQNDRETIEQQRRVPKEVRLWWGAIRNLLCGVTTVCHHNPLEPELLGDNFPVHVVAEMGWAHSFAMEPELVAKFQATAKDVPFVLHAAEGVDERSAKEIFELDRIGALDGRTVLVHGVALNQEGVALLNRRRAALVWCPTSNCFLFGRTHSVDILSTVQRVLLGSDSPLTGAGDLLDEVRFAHSQAGIAPDEIYRMVLTQPASVLRLKNGQGRIRPEAQADLVVVRDSGASPAQTVAKLTPEDVELVMVGGRVHLASEPLMQRLPGDVSEELRPLDVEGCVRWVRAPVLHLMAEAERALGGEVRIGKKRVRHVCTAWN